MLKQIFNLFVLLGLTYASNVTDVVYPLNDPELLSISKDVDDLKFLFMESKDNMVEIDFNNKASLFRAKIKSDLPLVITIDGFLSNRTSPMTTLLKESYTNRGTDNLIILDWAELSGSKAYVDNEIFLALAYLQVLENVDPIGKRLADFLELVEEMKGIPLSKVTIVGGSLGAHIAGATGTVFRKKYGSSPIGRIAGLDPAGPLFSQQISKDKRLHKDDAQFVDVYHSNRGGMGDSDHDMGHANFYINGGDNQPGCAEADQAGLGICSHTYAFRVFNLAFTQDVNACPCYGDKECTCNDCKFECPARTGEPAASYRNKGSYLVIALFSLPLLFWMKLGYVN